MYNNYKQHKLNMYARNVSAEKYSNFLSGHIWSDDLLKIDYESVVLNPSDYVLGYELHYRNSTRVVKTYNSASGDRGKQADVPLPTIRVVMSNMVCFGIDVPFEKNTWTFNIKVNFSPAYHAATNGAIERQHQTIKNSLKACLVDMGNVHKDKK